MKVVGYEYHEHQSWLHSQQREDRGRALAKH